MSKGPVRYRSHWGRARKDAEHRIVVNPLLAKEFPVLTRTGVFDKKALLSEHMLQENASWRLMSPFQPFVNVLVCEGDHTDGKSWRRGVIPKPWGSKGLLMDELFNNLGRFGAFAWMAGSEDFEDWSAVSTDDLHKIVGHTEALRSPRPFNCNVPQRSTESGSVCRAE